MVMEDLLQFAVGQGEFNTKIHEFMLQAVVHEHPKAKYLLHKWIAVVPMLRRIKKQYLKHYFILRHLRRRKMALKNAIAHAKLYLSEMKSRSLLT